MLTQQVVFGCHIELFFRNFDQTDRHKQKLPPQRQKKKRKLKNKIYNLFILLLMLQYEQNFRVS